jgi:Protein of unknown function (DUF3237)
MEFLVEFDVEVPTGTRMRRWSSTSVPSHPPRPSSQRAPRLAPETALGDIRYTLRTDEGDLLYVQSRSMRHGSADVLARLARGEDVGASEYTFRTSTRIETAAPGLEWLNKGVFIGVGARQRGAVIYETYLVG